MNNLEDEVHCFEEAGQFGKIIEVLLTANKIQEFEDAPHVSDKMDEQLGEIIVSLQNRVEMLLSELKKYEC